jgi:hypothetical protein
VRILSLICLFRAELEEELLRLPGLFQSQDPTNLIASVVALLREVKQAPSVLRNSTDELTTRRIELTEGGSWFNVNIQLDAAIEKNPVPIRENHCVLIEKKGFFYFYSIRRARCSFPCN